MDYCQFLFMLVDLIFYKPIGQNIPRIDTQFLTRLFIVCLFYRHHRPAL